MYLATRVTPSWFDQAKLGLFVQQALQETDEATRTELFEQIHILSMENPPFVPLTYTPNRVAGGNHVHNFNLPLTAIFRLETVHCVLPASCPTTGMGQRLVKLKAEVTERSEQDVLVSIATAFRSAATQRRPTS